jgi:hypothetical protein
MKSVAAPSKSPCELIESNAIEMNACNAQPINIYEDETKKKLKRALISEISASRLLPPQPLCRHRFKYEGDVSDDIFSV